MYHDMLLDRNRPKFIQKIDKFKFFALIMFSGIIIANFAVTYSSLDHFTNHITHANFPNYIISGISIYSKIIETNLLINGLMVPQNFRTDLLSNLNQRNDSLIDIARSLYFDTV